MQVIRPAVLLLLLQHGQFNSNIFGILHTLCGICIATVYNIVPASMRIDKLIAVIIQLICIFTLYIACINPISDLHALGHSSTTSRIIERTGNHTGIHYNIGAAGQELGHIIAGISGFVRTEMEEFTLVFKILHILVQQSVTKVTSSFIYNIQFIAAVGICAKRCY